MSTQDAAGSGGSGLTLVPQPQRDWEHLPLWEVVFVRRRQPRSIGSVVGRATFAAPDVSEARIEAELRRAQLPDPESVFLDVIVPLTGDAPGVHHYRVAFTEWREGGEAYRKAEVHEARVHALCAADARQLAQRVARTLPGYSGRWRIDRVEHVADHGAPVRHERRRADRHRGGSSSLRRLRALSLAPS